MRAGLSLLLGCGGAALAKDPYVRGMSGRTQQRVVARFRVGGPWPMAVCGRLRPGLSMT